MGNQGRPDELDWNDDHSVVKAAWPTCFIHHALVGPGEWLEVWSAPRSKGGIELGYSTDLHSPLPAYAMARRHESVQTFERNVRSSPKVSRPT